MGDEEGRYKVLWGEDARFNLAEMEKFKVNPNLVFNKSKHLLSGLPRRVAIDVVDFEDFKYNGYYWVLINNVIVVYIVFESGKKVFIDASFFANTAWSHQVFWGINPEDNE